MLCDVSSAANVRRESTVGNGKWDRGVGREVLLESMNVRVGSQEGRGGERGREGGLGARVV